VSEPTTEAGRALLAAYDPCYCEGTVCDVLPDLAARVAAIEAEAAQRRTAEVERLREALLGIQADYHDEFHIGAADKCPVGQCGKARAALAGRAVSG
jgi:hypothetical protein